MITVKVKIKRYLYRLSQLIVESLPLQQYKDGKKDLLKVITKPFTTKIVEVDSKGIQKVAQGEDIESLLKTCCKKVTYETNVTDSNTNIATLKNVTEIKGCQPCKYDYIFQDTGLDDSIIGIILLIISLVLLCICLFAIVKILNSLLKGNIRKGIKRFVNAEFPGKCSYFTGYVAIIVGCGLTILVQSSSIFTSTMTPLVGVGVIGLDRMYPLTLGANIGTTTTGILASLATSDITHALQVAFCHLFFNISGILLFYPIPFLRFPIPLAKFLGNETAKYRWFAIFYLILMFFPIAIVCFWTFHGWMVCPACCWWSYCFTWYNNNNHKNNPT
ncbi:hypothetical protein KUTeg_014148 [Tegillarca granosa]|uniref:Uncharacterized protein n=1 Tax=Tegillarca granosa TaxID=220873 RepID=A0ABQ9EVS5_TEGGR|nr:hypothetical protein KUTeg_014148 [Tegillarca granosa]